MADEMLRDLRSVKLRPQDRSHVDRLCACFHDAGSVPTDGTRWLHAVCRRYSAQLKELHAARERARTTNSLRSLGLTRAEAQDRAQARTRDDESAHNDLGF